MCHHRRQLQPYGGNPLQSFYMIDTFMYVCLLLQKIGTELRVESIVISYIFDALTYVGV